MQCQFCDEDNASAYIYEGDLFRACTEHAEEKFPVDKRQRIDFVPPDGVEFILSDHRDSMERDVNRFHFVEQAILGAAKIYNLETGYRITEVFASIRIKLDGRINHYSTICLDYGIDNEHHQYVRSVPATCPKCTNKMFHLDGYSMKDSLRMALGETVKQSDIVVCLRCGHGFVGKLS
ncbi:hypothetical protein KAR91_40365 [Candidatus Pacearchaeota archaeon]|nr:hypothetical protein [Candidatus Pacearchaeota archaeon]